MCYRCHTKNFDEATRRAFARYFGEFGGGGLDYLHWEAYAAWLEQCGFSLMREWDLTPEAKDPANVRAFNIARKLDHDREVP